MPFCCLEWWRHSKASLRQRGLELSFVWRRALVPRTFLFISLFIFFFFANSKLPRSIHLRGGNPKFLCPIQTGAAGTSLGLVPAPNSTAGLRHMNELAFTAKWFDLRILFLFWCLNIQGFFNLIFCLRNAAAAAAFFKSFFFLISRPFLVSFPSGLFLSIRQCLPCFSYLLFLLTARRVWGGELFAHKWLVIWQWVHS